MADMGLSPAMRLDLPANAKQSQEYIGREVAGFKSSRQEK
jgi:hypothetical protein